MKQEIKQVIITPGQAEELLKMNISNRTVRKKKVEELTEAMRRGEWELSNDAIVVSEGNILLNGQHRLMAVVKSGTPCPFILFTGAKDSAFDIMDTPALRRISDVITRKGGKNGNKMEATITRYINLHGDMLNGWQTMRRFNAQTVATRREVIDFYDKHEKLVDKWVKKVSSIVQRGMRLASEAQLASLAICLDRDLCHEDAKIVGYLEALLIDGETQNKTVLAVRRKLLQHKLKKENIDRHDILRYIIRGWNDYLMGREVSYIKTDEDSFYFIRPL